MARRCGTNDEPRELFAIGVVAIDSITGDAIIATTKPAFTPWQLYKYVDEQINRTYEKIGFQVNYTGGNDIFEGLYNWRVEVGNVVRHNDYAPQDAIAVLYAMNYADAQEAVTRSKALKQVKEYEWTVTNYSPMCETVRINGTEYTLECLEARNLQRRLGREWSKIYSSDNTDRTKVNALEAKLEQHGKEKPCCPKSKI